MAGALAGRIRNLRRFRFITASIFETGFGFLLIKARLKWLVPLECKVRCYVRACVRMWSAYPGEDEAPEKLKNLLIRLGPTFIKFGQVLSLRSDLLPDRFTRELAKLTSQVPPFPYEQAKSTIEKELRKPLNELFKSFDRKPFAAGSLAQVHRAVLPDGTSVAVKVQRPNIAKVVTSDIHILRYLARIIEQRVPQWQAYQPVRLIEEFAETIQRELDFRIEAVHAKRFAVMFAEEPSVKVARVFSELSARRVLTMEYIDGVNLNDEKALQKAGIDKKVLAENGVNALLKQIFIEGFFHADPHPGNYFATAGNVFAFIDYGMVGRLTARDRRELAAFFISFLSQDSERALRHLKRLTATSDVSNWAEFEHDVDDILHEWYGAKLRDIDIGRTFYRILESGRRNQVFVNSSFAYLGKALVTTEAMGRTLDSDFDFAARMKPYAAKIIDHELNPKKIRSQLADLALDYYTYLEETPEKLYQLIDRLSSGRLEVKVSQEEITRFSHSLKRQASTTLITAVAASTLIVTGLMYLIQNGWLAVHWNLATLAALFLAAVLFWGILRRKRNTL